MISQKIRAIAPEQDPLRMGRTVEDLGKPQIVVESTFGDSHPRGVLKIFSEHAVSLMQGGYME